MDEVENVSSRTLILLTMTEIRSELTASGLVSH